MSNETKTSMNSITFIGFNDKGERLYHTSSPKAANTFSEHWKTETVGKNGKSTYITLRDTFEKRISRIESLYQIQSMIRFYLNQAPTKESKEEWERKATENQEEISYLLSL